MIEIFAPFTFKSFVVSNVPWAPINVIVVPETVVLTTPYAPLLLTCVTWSPDVTDVDDGRDKLISVTAVKIWVEVLVLDAVDGLLVEVWSPSLSKNTTPWVLKSPVW